MATVRPGNRTALLVVDVQVGVLADAWDSTRVVSNVARVVQRARDAVAPILWIQHDDDELPQGCAQWRLMPEFVVAPSETLIRKRFNSAFEHTSLQQELERLQVTRVVLAGAATNWCIRATAYGALERGYDVTLIADAHTTGSIELDGRRIEPKDLVDELNVAMNWLSYPGRRNDTASAELVDFGDGGNTR